MDERRQGFADLQADVAKLIDGQQRLIHLLEGNGQPGFIHEVRDEIGGIKVWQGKREAIEDSQEKAVIRTISIGGVIVTLINIAISTIMSLFAKHP